MASGSDRNAEAFAANEALWDAWTAVHSTGGFYDLERFKAGGVRLRPYEIELVGDVSGRSLLHLQCHFGIDTLSWARLGARVTGADFSPAAVELARSLADELGFPDARFVRANLYDLPDVLDGTFDVVYTSRGVLGWLPDIRGWARGRGPLRRPGRAVLHLGGPPGRAGLRERGRGRRRAPPQLSVLGARRAARPSRSRARTRTRPPMSASRPSTAGTTASARSSPR